MWLYLPVPWQYLYWSSQCAWGGNGFLFNLELLRIPIDYQVYYTTSGDRLYLQYVSFHLVSCVKKSCAKCCYGNFVVLNMNLHIYTEINGPICHPCTLDPHSMALELLPWWLFCMKFSNCCTMLKHKMLNSSASAHQED